MTPRRLVGPLVAAALAAGGTVAAAAPVATAPEAATVAPEPAVPARHPQHRTTSRSLGSAHRPAATTAVTGIPQPCAARHPFPEGATPAQVTARLSAAFGVRLTGAAWKDRGNAPLVRIVWQTLDGVSCTSYLDVIRHQNPGFTLNAAPIRGYAWGDWGLTRPGAVTVDFGKWRTAYRADDRGRLVRLLVHELGHAWSRSAAGQATYQRFQAQYAHTGNFGTYAHSANETFSEVVGYYVARCAHHNPYDAADNRGGRFDAYYALVRQEVFGGREFGPAAGRPVSCTGA